MIRVFRWNEGVGFGMFFGGDEMIVVNNRRPIRCDRTKQQQLTVHAQRFRFEERYFGGAILRLATIARLIVGHVGYDAELGGDHFVARLQCRIDLCVNCKTGCDV